MIEFTIPPQAAIQLAVAVLLPLLVGLITNKMTASGLKAGLLALLAVVSSGLTELGAALLAGQPFDLGMWALTAVGSLATAIAMHYGIWKPSGASERLLNLGSPRRAADPDFGPGDGDLEPPDRDSRP